MMRRRFLNQQGPARWPADNTETTMRNLLLAATTAVLTTLSAVQIASAAATIPDNQARVNTLSAFAGDGVRNANAAIVAAPQAAQPARVQWLEIPARR